LLHVTDYFRGEPFLQRPVGPVALLEKKNDTGNYTSRIKNENDFSIIKIPPHVWHEKRYRHNFGANARTFDFYFSPSQRALSFINGIEKEMISAPRYRLRERQGTSVARANISVLTFCYGAELKNILTAS
jgi:hypothetical protein